jgi:hypothetical protein
MTLDAVQRNVPLDLPQLLGFKDVDFMHDMSGMCNHIDTRTGKLGGLFHPRCARRAQTHKLKTDPKVFKDVEAGLKPFDIRLNDRNYAVGDTLVLMRTKHSHNQMVKDGWPLIYTGEQLERKVTYMLEGPCYGLKKGWVIMTLEAIPEKKTAKKK